MGGGSKSSFCTAPMKEALADVLESEITNLTTILCLKFFHTYVYDAYRYTLRIQTIKKLNKSRY